MYQHYRPLADHRKSWFEESELSRPCARHMNFSQATRWPATSRQLPIERAKSGFHTPGPRSSELRGSPERGVYYFRLSVERHQMDREYCICVQ